MSNRIELVPTLFTNVRSGETSYGYRLYDDADNVYNNMWDSIPDDDLDCLRKMVEEAGDREYPFLSYLREYTCGMSIGGTWYEWEEIEDIICT